MKFETQEDIDAPTGHVFKMLTDFETFERAAMRRGAEVRRTDNHTAPAVGVSWAARFFLRGRMRDVTLEVTRCDPCDHLTLGLASSGLTGNIAFELIALSPSRTRLLVGLELQPHSLSARLLVQSLKLSKGAVLRKYEDRIAGFVQTLSDRHDRKI
ncbi:SRPBCC family protein [Roseobacter sp.]|uniref:SRPBCC family protein n=1 Tax=Roseobacter sp. TaxID=1907202 RepID=UPI0025DC71D3|nr:SRPBCC family protein [Roseobacter sp.]